MIGKLINRWRRAQNVTQAELCRRLRNHGWKLSPAKLSQLEVRAAKGIDKRLEFSHIEALSRATGLEDWELYFAAGLIPPGLRDTSPPPDQDQVRVGMALLYAALGQPEKGPKISYDAGLDTGVIPQPETRDEHARIEAALMAEGARELNEAEAEIAKKAAEAVFGSERPASDEGEKREVPPRGGIRNLYG